MRKWMKGFARGDWRSDADKAVTGRGWGGRRSWGFVFSAVTCHGLGLCLNSEDKANI